MSNWFKKSQLVDKSNMDYEPTPTDGSDMEAFYYGTIEVQVVVEGSNDKELEKNRAYDAVGASLVENEFALEDGTFGHVKMYSPSVKFGHDRFKPQGRSL